MFRVKNKKKKTEFKLIDLKSNYLFLDHLAYDFYQW